LIGSNHAGIGAGNSRRQTTIAMIVPATDTRVIRIAVIGNLILLPNRS
jgi:hypothetical protein